MKFDLFNEMLETAMDEEEAAIAYSKANGTYGVTTIIDSMHATYPARMKLVDIAGWATVDRCMKLLREERERQFGNKE